MSSRLIDSGSPKRMKGRSDGGGTNHRGDTVVAPTGKKRKGFSAAPTRSGATSRLLGSGRMFGRKGA